MTEAELAYSASNIQIFEGAKAIRKRPGMYIGTTSEDGLHHLVWEIIDNAVDEALAGFATNINVEIEKDNVIAVFDNGRGIPVGVVGDTGKTALEFVFMDLHSSWKFDNRIYKVSSGLHGVGATVVNALSEWLEATIYRDGKAYFLRFENEKGAVDTLQIIGDTQETGTLIRFKADPIIFKETQVYDYNRLSDRINQLAFLNKGLRINLKDSRGEKIVEDSFCFQGGIVEYVSELNNKKKVVHNEVIFVEGEEDGIAVEVALQYTSEFTTNLYSFCNNVNTHEGGMHESGFKVALNRVINTYARNNNFLKKDDENYTGDDILEGLTAIVSIKHPDPQFEGQTKTKLGNSEVRAIVSKIFGEQLERTLLEQPNTAKAILNKISLAAKARIESDRKKRFIRDTAKKNLLNIGTLPGKLADCSSNDPEISEIYLVEGDSAGGSAKDGRNREYQAILPLRGKVLNVEKARIHKVFDNNEIDAMITAFGCHYGENIDLTKLRYHKIVIMTDADVDGSHIRTLLLTFFYRYLKPIIEGGYLYFAMPPLYKIARGSVIHYAYSDRQLEDFKA